MSETDNNSVLMESRVMTDDEIYLILSYLTLKEKFRLSHVSKQFSDCVNQSIRCQKILRIRVTFRSNRFVQTRIVDLIIGEDLPLRELEFYIIREKFESTFRKLSNLKQLIFQLESINSQFCLWINTINIFPSIESIRIIINYNQRWNRNMYELILTSFRTKVT
jgi:hypothetical protein